MNESTLLRDSGSVGMLIHGSAVTNIYGSYGHDYSMPLLKILNDHTRQSRNSCLRKTLSWDFPLDASPGNTHLVYSQFNV